MQQLRSVQKQLEELKKDEDVIEMESHRRKRVKVDDLEFIPHNRPGDSEGTFRVPDWDSDDEIEVSESVPEKKNVFQSQAEHPTPRTTHTEQDSQPEKATPTTNTELLRQPEKAVPDDIQSTQLAPVTNTENLRQPAKAVPDDTMSTQQPQEDDVEEVVRQDTRHPLEMSQAERDERWERILQGGAKGMKNPVRGFIFPSVGRRRPEHEISLEESELARRDFVKGFEAWAAAQ